MECFLISPWIYGLCWSFLLYWSRKPVSRSNRKSMPLYLPLTAPLSSQLQTLRFTFTHFEQCVVQTTCLLQPCQNVFFNQNSAPNSPADQVKWPFHILLTICLKHYLISFPLFSLPTWTVLTLNHRCWMHKDLMQPMHFIPPDGLFLHFAKATGTCKSRDEDDVCKWLTCSLSLASMVHGEMRCYFSRQLALEIKQLGTDP
jgi:hypothetical protein